MTVAAYKNQNELVGTGSLFTGGIYTIAGIPINPDADQVLDIKVEDSQNVFIEDTFDVVVPKGAESETSTGQHRLLTKDGNICDPSATDFADCLNG